MNKNFWKILILQKWDSWISVMLDKFFSLSILIFVHNICNSSPLKTCWLEAVCLTSKCKKKNGIALAFLALYLLCVRDYALLPLVPRSKFLLMVFRIPDHFGLAFVSGNLKAYIWPFLWPFLKVGLVLWCRHYVYYV